MKKTLVLAFLSLLLGTTCVTPLHAATLDWTALPDGDFAVTTNWSSPPAAGDTLLIENGGTAWLNTEYSPATAVDIGDLGVGSTLGSGTLTVLSNGSLVTGASGTYNGLFLGGPNYTGTVNVNGGSIVTSPTDGIGAQPIYIGLNTSTTVPGFGFFNQTAGSTLCGNFMLGMNGTACVGTANISGGTLTAPGSSGVFVGGYPTGLGMFYQTGGTVSAGIFAVGYRPAYGYYSLSGSDTVLLKQVGAPSATRNFYVGKYGYGILEQTGGTVTAASRLIVSGDPSTVPTAPAYGVYNLSGGTATVCTGGTSSSYYSAIGACAYGNGVLNLSGTGSLEVKGGTTYGRLYVGYGPVDFTATSGIVNLGAVAGTEDPDGGGGTLKVNWLERSDVSTISGTVNFHGGTLVARNTITANSFLYRTTNYVYDEGAVIDTNGKNVYIDTVLAAPASKGITGITLGSAGTGYTAPPVVVIADNNLMGTPGTGATAIAKVTGGALQIVMTNPGTGYSDPSTIGVTLYGGDGSGAALGTGTVTLADNVSGGLTKKSLGALTLSAANTYTGATVIEAGKLSLAATGSITSNVTVKDTAVLGGAGTVTGDVAVETGGTVAPGASAGRLTIAGDLDMAATGNMTWELAMLNDDAGGVAGTDFDQILLTSGDLDLGTAAKLTLDFSLLAAADQPSADPLATFWTTSHQWKVIDVDATAGGTNTGGTDFATIAFSGTMPTKVVFDTLVGSGADLGDIFLTAAPGNPVQIPGDANGDGKVNDVDAQAVASSWGTASGATWQQGDFNKDGAVNAADASILAANWHYGVTEGATVPEPSMLALLLAGALALLARRR